MFNKVKKVSYSFCSRLCLLRSDKSDRSDKSERTKSEIAKQRKSEEQKSERSKERKSKKRERAKDQIPNPVARSRGNMSRGPGVGKQE